MRNQGIAHNGSMESCNAKPSMALELGLEPQTLLRKACKIVTANLIFGFVNLWGELPYITFHSLPTVPKFVMFALGRSQCWMHVYTYMYWYMY